jgi:hypothetical protein
VSSPVVVIEQAKGITIDQAYQRIRAHARRDNPSYRQSPRLSLRWSSRSKPGRHPDPASILVRRSLTDDQMSRPASSEHTHLADLRAPGSTGSSSGVALADGPEPDELADFGSALGPGRRSS